MGNASRVAGTSNGAAASSSRCWRRAARSRPGMRQSGGRRDLGRERAARRGDADAHDRLARFSCARSSARPGTAPAPARRRRCCGARPPRSLPSATLDRLLRESLDLASHWLDAWVTSLATQRLSRDFRADKPTVPTSAPRCGPRPHSKTPAGGEAARSPAGTADAEQTATPGLPSRAEPRPRRNFAVLRSAHAAHGDGEAFAVTLESARVRRGLALFDGVRQGQVARGVLGYCWSAAVRARRPDRDRQVRDAAPLRTSALPPPAAPR